jgi:hypothetical protein
MNMKLGWVKTHIYFKGLLSSFCSKNLINTKQFFVEFRRMKTIYRMVENKSEHQYLQFSRKRYLQTFKELFTWRHNVALNIARKTIIILLRTVQLQLRNKQGTFNQWCYIFDPWRSFSTTLLLCLWYF